LKRIQQQQLEIQQYEHCPLSQVSAWSDIPHGESLFESILVFENYPIEDGLLDRNKGLKVSVLRSWERTNYPLTVAAAIANDSLSLQIGYDRRRFDESAITRMLGHMQVLLEAILSDPEQPLSNLSLLSREEWRQCLVSWNETQAEYSREQLTHESFERQAALWRTNR
jgi:non-ribosomal peptide synthetase component F